MRPKNKKGVSPLIATVLLVGFVVVLGLLFFLFAKKQIVAQTEKIEFGEQFGVDISASCLLDAGTTKVTLSNLGTKTIDGIRIICTENSGEATSPPATLINCKPGEECPVTYNLMCNQVEVLPGIVQENGEAKFVLGTDKSVTVSCSQ